MIDRGPAPVKALTGAGPLRFSAPPRWPAICSTSCEARPVRRTGAARGRRFTVNRWLGMRGWGELARLENPVSVRGLLFGGGHGAGGGIESVGHLRCGPFHQ
ncbi:hypothetical protein GCM10010216_72390 [Streptomyces flaveolus]|nr:hypothetical protein GCM10010216_72390 [Streptomyces flaveolus]